jgi:Fe2+ or Zn2+ uptake regulation protein
VDATAELHETAAVRLRGVAQRYTKNRQAVVEVLATTDRPLTIPELLDHDDRLAQSSAYRNLAVLEQAGIVHRIVTSDEFARYELAEDLTGHHHHLICSRCGAVEDFTASKHLERSLDRAVHQVVSDTGFTVEHHRLDLIGQCGDCRR